MKIINKLEFTKEELETLEKAKKILEQLNSYPETQLSACFDNYCDIVEVVMETENGVSDILQAYKNHRSCVED